MPELLDGKKVAESIFSKILLEISLLPIIPKIVFVRVGARVAQNRDDGHALSTDLRGEVAVEIFGRDHANALNSRLGCTIRRRRGSAGARQAGDNNAKKKHNHNENPESGTSRRVDRQA